MLSTDADAQVVERENFEKIYYDLSTRIQLLINKIEKTTNGSLDVSCSGTAILTDMPRERVGVRLPVIELTTFDGKFHKWLEFQASFDGLIHKNESLSKIQKLFYLKSALKGEAATIVQNLDISETSYDTARELLKNRFENKQVIINLHLKALFDILPLQKESLSGLRAIHDSSLQHIRALQALHEPAKQWDLMLIHVLVNKLDSMTRKEWERECQTLDVTTLPTLEQLHKFLLQRCIILENMNVKQDKTDFKQRHNHSNKSESKSFALFMKNCPLCKNNHPLYRCEKFKNYSVKERNEHVKRLNICVNCLRGDHLLDDCKFTHCKRCEKRHNTLLHIEEQTKTEKNAVNSNDSQKIVCSQAFIRKYSQTVLSTVILLVTNKYGEKMQCRALLDSGSQASLISEALVNQLQITTKRQNSSLIGITQSTAQLKYAADVKIASMYNNFVENLECLVVPSITEIETSPVDRNKLKIPQNLIMADSEFHKGGKVDLLLGANIFWDILRSGKISINKYGPILQETVFGWIIGGNIQINDKYVNRYSSYFARTNTETEINENLIRFWNIEDIADKKIVSEVDQACEDLFLRSFTRDDTGAFVVKIPFNEKLPLLGNSREMAVQRWFTLENRLERDAVLKTKYSDFMNEYIKLGHMYEVDELSNTYSQGYYLPHHPVFKKVGNENKIRVVFDASAKTDSGLSLNNVQHTGPVLLNDIFSVLLRFRKYTFAMSADIVKMYRMINICPEERMYQRIFWRENKNDNLKCFELKTVTYGTASAPYLAVRTLHQVANECNNENPLVSKIIKEQFYMDDVLMGADTIDESLKIKTALSEVLIQSNFKLDKWLTNFSTSSIGIDTEKVINIVDSKILGVLWDTQNDDLCYSFDFENNNTDVNKRNILSLVAKFYDPLGILAPILIIGKLILQELWLRGVDWDEKVPDEIRDIWIDYREQLKYINHIRVPRHVLSKNVMSCELHGFSDASKKAYGACFYMRSVTTSGEVIIKLLCARSKVAPIKVISIPRLELCAAVLLAKLYTHIIKSSDLGFENAYFWCDSNIVLSWLKAPANKWKVFVANRVSKIQSVTCTDNWNYVNTLQNPADLISRGVKPKELVETKLWFQGPFWLIESKETWPKFVDHEMDSDSLSEIERVRVNTNVIRNKFELFEKYSSLRKLQRVFSYILRFIANIQARLSNKPLQLEPFMSTSELQNSLNHLIKIAQGECFSDEIKQLLKSKQLKSRNTFIELNPFLDEDKLLRVGGRLRNSNFEYEKIHPIILPPKHPLTKLIVTEEHIRLLHAGPQLLLASLREKYWPINGRNICRNIVRNCITCFKTIPRGTQPMMGNLPSARVTISGPFYNVGIDYAGPFLVKDRTLRGAKLVKCYACLFVCMATKAIHIELVGDLSTEAFMAAIWRFIARRGRPQTIFSDNGTNFVGAYAEIKRIIDFLKQSEEKIKYDLSSESITWKFIPPHAPNFGGLWEAAVRAMKVHMRKIIGNLNLTYEELYTLMVRIEGTLNSRPLYSLSNNPKDLNPLTPAHFIIGRSITALPERDISDIQTNRLKRYQLIQQGLQHFWQRWSREYIAQLQIRSKWSKSATPIALDDLVLVQEDGTPPYRWPLGRVVEIHPGSDEVIRVVSIKMRGKTVKRPVSKVCVLPLKEEIEESTTLQGGQDVRAQGAM